MSKIYRILSVCLGLTAGLLLGSGAVLAQDETAVGVKGGLTLAKLEGSSEELGAFTPDVTREKGFAVGLFLDLPLGDAFSVQPELVYQRRYSGLEYPPGTYPGVEDDTYEIHMTYLELPVLLKYTAGHGSVRPVIFVGPSVALNLEAEAYAQTADDGTESIVDIKDEVSDLDLGVTVGAGLELGALSIEGRYIHGLTDVDETTDPEPMRWRTFLATLGFVF